MDRDVGPGGDSSPWGHCAAPPAGESAPHVACLEVCRPREEGRFAPVTRLREGLQSGGIAVRGVERFAPVGGCHPASIFAGADCHAIKAQAVHGSETDVDRFLARGREFLFPFPPAPLFPGRSSAGAEPETGSELIGPFGARRVSAKRPAPAAQSGAWSCPGAGTTPAGWRAWACRGRGPSPSAWEPATPSWESRGSLALRRK